MKTIQALFKCLNGSKLTLHYLLFFLSLKFLNAMGVDQHLCS